MFSKFLKCDIVTESFSRSAYNNDVKKKQHRPLRTISERRITMSVLHITKENFENEVLKSDRPVLLDFWASWCGPCRMVSPIIDEIAEETTDKKVCKINVDEQPELAQAFGVMSIPTLVVMKDGEVVGQSVGVKSKEAILHMLNG